LGIFTTQFEMGCELYFKTEFDMVSELFMKDSDKDCQYIYMVKEESSK